MKIVRNGSKGVAKGTDELFTGSAFIELVLLGPENPQGNGCICDVRTGLKNRMDRMAHASSGT
ncbi:hypothetical protein, partial [Methermicoccus shengliensis]|uniref:hypothetical protein n=1 Tax=Methermicoccus shengliensis TaxID=660064 RepID=UPI0005B28187